jgi:hypothetical protein
MGKHSLGEEKCEILGEARANVATVRPIGYKKQAVKIVKLLPWYG